MFAVDEITASAVQTAFHERGEWAAVVELRRHFAIQDNEVALRVVRVIAGWRAAARKDHAGNADGAADTVAPSTAEAGQGTQIT
ncbi:hypothetical protein [Roseomonas genomospecies 6]|uniref:Uncharacterized protein n=1 Tax=Roseomonas genomospecies 6 TaxID=214106 RepID=A0A9W7KQF9_9PROT|nr:hypothetical protein [Roseomonas genomospecies 6]KAA0677642.1 hypothetical protein DS843_22655 [Roseomonas genomospecies 6]